MEESEKRRERLKAMRAAATTTDTTADDDRHQQTLLNIPPLANPLVDANPSPSATQPPRFDFYTDPLAAFSSHKPPPSSGSHSGAHQFHNSYVQHQGGVPYYSPSSTGRPLGAGSPYQGHPFTNRCPGPPTGPVPGYRNPFPAHQGSPSFSSAPYNGQQYHNNPSPGPLYPEHQGNPSLRPHAQGPGQWPNNSPSPGMGQWRNNSPNPGMGQYPNNRPSPGMGQWRNNSPSPTAGRGRGRWEGSGGRGRGRGNSFNGQGRSFFDRSMIEDPWKLLEPVVWQSDDDGSFFNSWGGSVKMTSSSYAAKNEPHDRRSNRPFRFDPTAKKARVSNVSGKTGNAPSLAEFLASAVDEDDEDKS